MKKLLLATVLASMGVSLFASTAFADDGTTQDDNPTNYDSELSIKFAKDEGSQTKGPYSGRLSFTWAPKAFNFGENEIKFGTGVEYDLKNSTSESQYIVVNEDRKDTDQNFGKKWNVKVKMSELTADPAGDDKLPATLKISLNKLQSYNMGTTLNLSGDDVDPAKPWTPGVMSDLATAPTDVALASTTLNIPADGKTDVPVLSQTADRTADDRVREGWGTKIGDQKLQFVTLDTGVADKEYKATVVWTLTRDII